METLEMMTQPQLPRRAGGTATVAPATPPTARQGARLPAPAVAHPPARSGAPTAALAPAKARVGDFLVAVAGVKHLWATKEIACLLEIHPRTWRRWWRRAGIRPCVYVPNHGQRWTVAGVLAVLANLGKR